MSVQVFWYSAARRSLSQCLSRSRYHSLFTLSSVSGRVQDSEVSTSPAPRGGVETVAYGADTDAKDPLDVARLNRYFASIKAANLEPTLGDVERCKPGNFSRPDSPRYAAEYTNLLETLCRSFSKDQLRRFTELYKLDSIWTRASRRKTEYAESIIEKAWGWPSLKEIERRQRDTTEVLVKSFAVTPSQLFLIMGKDGADLLQLSMQYNVHISLTPNPLALRVEGLRGSLKGLAEYVSSLKKGIIDEIFELPSSRPVRPDLLQRISRLSGAYVENHGNRGKIRICAKDFGDITTARSLALRASLEVGMREHTVCYNPPSKTRDSPIESSEPQTYAMYPFATPSPFPWTIHPGSAFRLRRITDWLGVDSCENIAITGGLTDNSHRLLNLSQGEEEFSQLVCSATHENPHSRKTITASLGHVLVSSGDNSQRDGIFPPLRGNLPLPGILKWIETSKTPLTFVPSVPSAMMTGSVDDQNVLHRLIYKTLLHTSDQLSKPSQHVFKLEISCPSLAGVEVRHYLGNAPKFEGASRAGSLSENLNEGWDLSCRAGREAHINLMLPDRPTDIQLCIFDWDGVTLMQQPQILREYADRLRDFVTNEVQSPQPDPPSTFTYEGRTYYLHDSLNLRQNNNLNLPSIISSDLYAGDVVQISSESIVDLQSSQKIERCQVKIDGGSSWKHFLTVCDQLSTASFKLQRKDKL